MSKTNIEQVQNAYAAFGRGDIPTVIEMMTSRSGSSAARRTRPSWACTAAGPGPRSSDRQLADAHEIHTFEPRSFLAAEDEVFVWGHYRWTMRQSGVSKDTEWLHVITMRDGKLAVWRGHNDTAMLTEAYHGRPPRV